MTTERDELGHAMTTPLPSDGATVDERGGRVARGPERDDGSDAAATVIGASDGLEDAPAPLPTIGRFTVERELGAGGMGRVLLAHDATLDRQVAIKLLRHDSAGDASSAGRVRLLREAQAMARLRHPNVVTVYEAGVHEGRVYLVMEYVAGGTLRAWLDARGAGRRAGRPRTVTADEILARFAAAGRGLHAAHRAGVIHRDFKPENALVDEDGVVKVTDFGLARGDGEPPRPRGSRPELDALSHELTRTGDVMGTPRYMAPEQHTAEPTDARTDQFSFCVALYEALYGQHPFGGESYAALRAAVLEQSVRSPPAGVEAVHVHAAIVRGLSRTPAARFPSMAELLEAIAPAPAAGIAPGRGRRPRARVLAVGAGVVVAGAGVVTIVGRGGEPADPVAAARRAAAACDCELVSVELPPGAVLAGTRRVVAEGLGSRLPVALVATGQLAVPRGAHVIDYRAGGATYSYAIVARGAPASRAVVLPAPESRDGYVFVPGGEVTIGDDAGDASERPASLVTLAPYLIGAAEASGEPMTYAEAVIGARARSARLPTAAEWEWAARLGVAGGMLATRWEWTATAYADYPYLADGRDDQLAERGTSEVRGGHPDGASTSDRPARRRNGSHLGHAELRLARTARAVDGPRELVLQLHEEPVGDPWDPRTRSVLPRHERTRLHAFLVAWSQLPEPPALQVANAPCTFSHELAAAGVPGRRVEYLAAGATTGQIVLRYHPDPAFERVGRFVCADSETEQLGRICFDGARVHPAAQPVLDAVAATLAGNPALTVTIRVRVPSSAPVALAQQRADAVRARLIELGVAPARLVARGGGVVPVNPDPPHGLFEEPGAPAGDCPPAEPGESVAFELNR